ncbi:exopolysaccharide biosynthesis polyprenyl glycosylphosphotransferase [Porphyrobacter algicida]|uniref:Exopolysaccharide biosynthesis polyprenyl glycosylphosphotransferase n=1 Tax=Qipengyuania algicida TaxID=1836209 RepID=A0A845AGQ5_9SPHN|nr:exopolysaccharide biosynthesis polyprenyl glycosylphosphotransferase [Qipengyuania algicida]MXP28647.1 exopolysaccharide biosynthesis polyprenyl glycosylphosphotransferase [Qipengyuania algicida]
MKDPGSLEIDEQDAAIVARDMHSRQTARLSLYARLILSDALAVIIAFGVANQFRDEAWLAPNGISLIFVILPLLVIVAGNMGAYTLEVLSDFAESARRIVYAIVQTFMIVFAVFFITQTAADISRVGVAVVFSTTLLVALLGRYLAHRWVKNALQGVLFDELVIVDSVPMPKIQARFVVDARQNGLEPDLSDPAMLERFARATDFYDRVVVACSVERQAQWATLLKSINATGELLVEQRNEVGVIGIDNFSGLGTLIVSRGSLSLADRIKKRMFDIAIALPAVILLGPLLILVAIGIKLDSRGPVFFRQPRVGRNNVPFMIYKFRSMRQDASDAQGNQSTRRDDDRISRFGRFIRRTSIDEIPQLFNVIKGEMSIVGPRPHALGSTADDRLFWEITQRYWERHALKPGITGLAQIRGFRGATEKTSDLTNRLQSDLEYLSGWRLWRDVEIMFATLRVLVHPNAY